MFSTLAPMLRFVSSPVTPCLYCLTLFLQDPILVSKVTGYVVKKLGQVDVSAVCRSKDVVIGIIVLN